MLGVAPAKEAVVDDYAEGIKTHGLHQHLRGQCWAIPDENVPDKFYLISWGTLTEAMYRAHGSEPDNPQVACISNYIQVHVSIGS